MIYRLEEVSCAGQVGSVGRYDSYPTCGRNEYIW